MGTRLTTVRSPLVVRWIKGTRPVGYAAIDKRLASPWGLDREPSDGVKLTYVYLALWAEKISRWVFASQEKLAAARCIPVRTLIEHLKELERLGLVLRIPMCDVIPRSRKRAKTVFLLDFPIGFGGIEETEEEVKAAADMEAEFAKTDFSRRHAATEDEAAEGRRGADDAGAN